MSLPDVHDLIVHPGQGEQTASDMRMIFRSAQLDGHFSIMEGEVRPGELLAFHTHANEDQHMYIINGTLNFEIGGAEGLRFTAGAGSHVLKPRGITHGFWNLSEETVRYVETSTRSGFEHFVDSRQDGLRAMMSTAREELGMTFQLDRAVAVLKEFNLTGLAGANIPDAQSLMREPGMLQALQASPHLRELAAYLGRVKLRQVFHAH